MSLALTNKTLQKYFNFLDNFDLNSKKKLISKLSESIKDESDKKKDFGKLFGAWEDSRSSDEIIDEIYLSRIEKKDVTSL